MVGLAGVLEGSLPFSMACSWRRVLVSAGQQVVMEVLCSHFIGANAEEQRDKSMAEATVCTPRDRWLSTCCACGRGLGKVGPRRWLFWVGSYTGTAESRACVLGRPEGLWEVRWAHCRLPGPEVPSGAVEWDLIPCWAAPCSSVGMWDCSWEEVWSATCNLGSGFIQLRF